MNRLSYEDGSPLILTAIPTFLLVFDTIYTLQTTGSAILGQNSKKVAKKSNFISSKLLIVEDLSITLNDRNTQVSIVDLCKNRFWTTGSPILGGKKDQKWTKSPIQPQFDISWTDGRTEMVQPSF